MDEKAFVQLLKRKENQNNKKLYKKEKEEREKIIKEKEHSLFLREQETFSNEKLMLAKSIFELIRKFKEKYQLNNLLGEISIFCDNSFGTNDKEGYGFNSSVLLYNNIFLYNEHYKWMNGRSFKIKSPEEMAENLSYKYLKKMYNVLRENDYYKKFSIWNLDYVQENKLEEEENLKKTFK